MGWDGDADLQNALGLSNSFNATILEFDFIPLGTKISFDYMLSSEQYLTNPSSNQCNFTDGFAFLLKEVGTSTYQNLAVIPGTTIPVKINTVRGSGTICSPANEQYFDAFNGNNHPTNFNGQTKTLRAEANVTPGNTYHIKLVIADEGNYRYDSAIFLGGGSFNFGVDLGLDRTIAKGNPICQSENTISLDATTIGATNYQWKFNGTNLAGQTNALLNFTAPYNPQTQNGTYTAEVTIGSSCIASSKIILEFAENLIIDETEFTVCDEDSEQDGKSIFDLASIKPLLFTNLPLNYQVSFFETNSSTTALPLLFTNTLPFSQTIYARVTNIQGCYSDYPITLKVKTFGANITNETISLCNENSITIDAGNGFVSYNWNTNPIQTTQTITTSTPGTYIVTIENTNGCFLNKTFTIIGSEIATLIDININDFSENNSATIIVGGTGNYEFSLDGINYQESAVFNNLEAALYHVYIKDKNGCGIITDTFYILDYPNFFTPNNDGYNDTWQVNNLDKRDLKESKIYIFDRYGKLLKELSPLGNGWNGIFNGNILPASDYWFILELTNGKTVKGHFALKR